MEQIGYINKSLTKLTYGVNSLDSIINSTINFDDRDIVEGYNNVVQPICAGTIITKDNKILIIRKSSNSTGNFSPEKDKTLLYIGGHLDITDMLNDSLNSFKQGMKREIKEELNYSIIDSQVGSPILIYTPITEKSAKHLGIIFPIIIDKSFNTNFTDGKCEFIDISELDRIHNLESWSEFILQELVCKLYKVNFKH